MIGQAARRVILCGHKSATAMNVPVRTIYPQVSSNVVSGLPRVKISFPEKVATGVFLAACILITPAWVVTHMDEYRGGAADE